jgi:hypothetical protein
MELAGRGHLLLRQHDAVPLVAKVAGRVEVEYEVEPVGIAGRGAGGDERIRSAVRAAALFDDLVEAAWDLYRADLYRAVRWPLPSLSGSCETPDLLLVLSRAR